MKFSKMIKLKKILLEQKISNFDIFNETDIKVNLNDIIKKLNYYIKYVEKKYLPLKIKICKETKDNPHSYYDEKNKAITLKVLKSDNKKRIEWKLAHEFAHFLRDNNENMRKCSSEREQKALQDFLCKSLDMSEKEAYEIFHDFYPKEIFSNIFAAMIVGDYYKIHPFARAEKELKKIKVKRNK